MKKLFLGVAFVVASVVIAAPVSAQENAYRQELMRYMEKSGALAVTDQIMDQLIPSIQQITSQDVPAEFWKGFRAKWNEKARTALVDIYEPIYRKYLTLSDLQQIVAFYDSPVGRKLAAATPAITRDGMQAGQQLGMEIAQEMIQEMQVLGYQ